MKWYQSGLDCVLIGVLFFIASEIALVFHQFLLGKVLGYSGLGLVGLGILLVVVSWFKRK